MRLDGPTFAHAFLAVFAAAATDAKSVFHKSIALEVMLHGVRLSANDGRMMLTAYVPDLEHHYDGPPADDVAPERVIVLNDDDGRGRGLLGYVCQLGTRHRYGFEDYTPGAVEIRVEHDQKLPPGAADQQTFEGMESVYTVLHVPDREKVHLQIVPIDYPDWRRTLAHQAEKAGSRAAVDLNPETLERLGKVRKHAFGALRVTLGRTAKALCRVEFLDSDPYVYGAILPLEDADADVYQSDGPGEEEEVDPDQITLEDVLGVVDEVVTDAIDSARESFPEAQQIDELAARRQTTPVEESDDTRLVRAAVTMIVETQHGSARMLQRKLGIPAARAYELMDRLEAHGVVGPADGPRARDVKIRADHTDEIAAAIWSITDDTRQD